MVLLLLLLELKTTKHERRRSASPENRPNVKRLNLQKRKENAKKRGDAKSWRLTRQGPLPLLQKPKGKRKPRPKPQLRNRSLPLNRLYSVH
jgi:hypothetical protein